MAEATLTLEKLQEAVLGAAAFRCRRTLQPGGGPGTKVFPPTYAGAAYAIEPRRMPRRDGSGESETVTCVLLDSVQSQANRMEEALQEAVDQERISIPVIGVDFTPFYEEGKSPHDLQDDPLRLLHPIGKVTSLQAPHRLADAILRDSVLADGGEPFRSSEHAQRWRGATPRAATPVYELCPTALLFGMWGSPDKPGGLGAKFERAIVSEIVGVGCPSVFKEDESMWPQNLGLRHDPLNISKNVHVKIEGQVEWEVDDNGNSRNATRPSEINHSNVPFPKKGTVAPGGVTVDHAEQTMTLSLICLRRLQFPIESGVPDAKVNDAARTVLAALGLCAATLAGEKGLDLRSRCLLWPDGPMEWELLDKPGEEPRRFTLSGEEAVALLEQAVRKADQAGLTWHKAPIKLRPSQELVKLVRKSQDLAAKGKGEEGEA